MIMGLIESLILGISIATIPGPIFFEIARRTLTKSFWSGILVTFGDFIGNLLILLLIFFGLSQFLTFNTSKIIFYLIGSLILLWTGVKGLILKKENIETLYKEKISNRNSIVIGFGIAVSSPIVVAFWISLSGSYLAQYANQYMAFLNLIFINIGFIIFDLSEATFIHFSKRKIPSKYIISLSRIFGVVLLIFGSSFFYNFIKLAVDYFI